MLKVLSIAGSDPSGGAGIQADLKTFAAHNVYGAAALTALTVQNTQGVHAVLSMEPSFLEAQLESLLADMTFDAIKLGMLFSQPLMEVVTEFLRKHPKCPVVLDPVMVATSGDRLLQQDAESYMRDVLLPLATLCTPNLAEAEVFVGHKINSQSVATSAMEQLAKKSGTAILLKGGHSTADMVQTQATDFLIHPQAGCSTYTQPRIATPHTHGTGCTLSSALACRLAEGLTLNKATELAKAYLQRALSAGQHLLVGKGRGPVWHGV